MTDKIVELIKSYIFQKVQKSGFFLPIWINKQTKYIDPETILNVEIWKKYF